MASTATALHNAICQLRSALAADDQVLNSVQRGEIWAQAGELTAIFGSLKPEHEEEADRLARDLDRALNTHES